jgi:hypothetical protein
LNNWLITNASAAVLQAQYIFTVLRYTRCDNFISFVLFSLSAFAGQNNSQPIMAERKGAGPVDLFKSISMESLLNIPTGEKLNSCEMILSGKGEIFKYRYDVGQSTDFKYIMTKLKERAPSGYILFADEIKTASGAAIAPVKFDLK